MDGKAANEFFHAQPHSANIGGAVWRCCIYKYKDAESVLGYKGYELFNLDIRDKSVLRSARFICPELLKSSIDSAVSAAATANSTEFEWPTFWVAIDFEFLKLKTLRIDAAESALSEDERQQLNLNDRKARRKWRTEQALLMGIGIHDVRDAVLYRPLLIPLLHIILRITDKYCLHLSICRRLFDCDLVLEIELIGRHLPLEARNITKRIKSISKKKNFKQPFTGDKSQVIIYLQRDLALTSDQRIGDGMDERTRYERLLNMQNAYYAQCYTEMLRVMYSDIPITRRADDFEFWHALFAKGQAVIDTMLMYGEFLLSPSAMILFSEGPQILQLIAGYNDRTGARLCLRQTDDNVMELFNKAVKTETEQHNFRGSDTLKPIHDHFVITHYEALDPAVCAVSFHSTPSKIAQLERKPIQIPFDLTGFHSDSVAMMKALMEGKEVMGIGESATARNIAAIAEIIEAYDEADVVEERLFVAEEKAEEVIVIEERAAQNARMARGKSQRKRSRQSGPSPKPMASDKAPPQKKRKQQQRKERTGQRSRRKCSIRRAELPTDDDLFD